MLGLALAALVLVAMTHGLMARVLAQTRGCARATPNLLPAGWAWQFPAALVGHGWVLLVLLPPAEALVCTGLLSLLGVLAAVDARTGVLPNEVTLPLLLTGLAWQAWQVGGVPDSDVLWGVVWGYGAARAVSLVGQAATGLDVLGPGDAKLLAGLGAWFGLQALALIWIVASVWVIVYTALRWCRGLPRQVWLPLGPFLAAGADFILMMKTCLSWV